MTQELLQYLVGLLIMVLSYFLKEALNRIKALETQAAQSDREIALLKLEQKQGFRHLEALINQKFGEIDRRLSNLDTNLNNLINKE